MNNIAFVQKLLKGMAPDEDPPIGRPALPPAISTPDVAPTATFTPRPTQALPVIAPPAEQPAAIPANLPAINPGDPPPIAPELMEQGLPQIAPTPMQVNLPAYAKSPLPADQVTAGMPVIDDPARHAAAPPALPAIEPARTKAEQDLMNLDAKRYNKGEWRLSDGTTTNNPQKAAADPNAEVITEPGKDRDKKWSIGDKIASALVGWAGGGLAGGVKAATDRNFFEKMGDANQRERLLPQIAAEQQIEAKNAQVAATRAKPILAQQEIQRKIEADKRRFDNQTAALEAKGRAAADKWKPYVDEQGRRWMQFENDPNRPMEPIIDPTTREQDVDPNFKLYDYTDPATGTTVQITGRILSDRGVRQAEFNARQEQSAATTNASNAIRVMTENAGRHMQYQTQVAGLINQAISTDPGLAGDAAVSGLRTEFDAKQKELDGMMQNPPMEGDEAAARAWATRVNKLNDDLATTANKLWTEVGKTEAGKAKANQIRGVIDQLKPPPRVTYTPIKPVTVKPGRPVPKAKDPLGLFQ